MSGAVHRVRAYSLELAVASEEEALRLQPRLGDFNRDRLLPVVERVCDELAAAGRHQRLERIEIDLGALPAVGFEAAAEERLYREFKAALERALAAAGRGEGAGGEELSEAEVRRRLLAAYLTRGYLPYWADPASRFDTLFDAVAAAEPDALVALVVHLGGSETVLRRLAAQLGEAQWRRLIELLEPEHGDLILSYLFDLEYVHRFERLLALSDRRFSRLVRQLALAYLVEERGSQFNRRSFVRSLLSRIARGQGLSYALLLGTLVNALERSRRHRPPRSSLPAVILFLAQELAAADGAEGRVADPDGMTARADAEPAPTAGATPLPAAADPLSRPELERTLAARAPAEAALLLAFVDAVATISIAYRPATERVAGVVLEEVLRLNPGQRLGEAGFSRILWRLFGRPLPEPVSRPLRAATGEWQRAGRLPEEAVAGFAAAVAALEPRHPAPPPAAHPTADPAAARRAALLGRLLAELPAVAAGERTIEAQPPRAGEISDEALLRGLRELLAAPGDEAVTLIRERARDARRRRHWARDLPEEALEGLSLLLEPVRGRELLAPHRLLTRAWQAVAPPSRPSLAARTSAWELLLAFLAGESVPGATRGGAAGLVEGFFHWAAARSRAGLATAAAVPRLGRALLARSLRLARHGGHGAVVEALRTRRDSLLAAWATGAETAAAGRPVPEGGEGEGAQAGGRGKGPAPSAAGPSRPARPLRGPTAFNLGGDERRDEGEPIYLGNAGLVLVGPFLPRLVQALGWDPADREGAGRVAHLLQHLVDGRCDAPEPELVLNKLLCGLAPEEPIARAHEPADGELDLCATLLQSLLANWPALANTSIAGLRETFLQRQGKLLRSADGWRLTVQRKTLDVLVDQVPWSISVLYHPWMREAIYVDW